MKPTVDAICRARGRALAQQRPRQQHDEGRREERDRRCLGERQVAQPAPEAERREHQEQRAQRAAGRSLRVRQKPGPAAMPRERRDDDHLARVARPDDDAAANGRARGTSPSRRATTGRSRRAGTAAARAAADATTRVVGTVARIAEGDRSSRLLQQLAQHERQDAAVPVVVDLDRRVDAAQHAESRASLPSLRVITSVSGCCGLMSSGTAMSNVSSPSMPSDSRAVAGCELQRQHAHADEVRAMDALEALRDDRLDAEQLRALRRPVARAAGAVFLAAEDDRRHALRWYCIAAS